MRLHVSGFGIMTIGLGFGGQEVQLQGSVQISGSMDLGFCL